MKIKNMVNQVLRLLNGIAVLGLTPATAAAKTGLNIAYSFWLGLLPKLATPAPGLVAEALRAARSGAFLHSTLILPPALPRAQPPQDPAQRAKLPDAIAKAQRHAAHSAATFFPSSSLRR
jgi:hypothetical protein